MGQVTVTQGWHREPSLRWSWKRSGSMQNLRARLSGSRPAGSRPGSGLNHRRTRWMGFRERRQHDQRPRAIGEALRRREISSIGTRAEHGPHGLEAHEAHEAKNADALRRTFSSSGKSATGAVVSPPQPPAIACCRGEAAPGSKRHTTTGLFHSGVNRLPTPVVISPVPRPDRLLRYQPVMNQAARSPTALAHFFHRLRRPITSECSARFIRVDQEITRREAVDCARIGPANRNCRCDPLPALPGAQVIDRFLGLFSTVARESQTRSQVERQVVIATPRDERHHLIREPKFGIWSFCGFLRPNRYRSTR